MCAEGDIGIHGWSSGPLLQHAWLMNLLLLECFFDSNHGEQRTGSVHRTSWLIESTLEFTTDFFLQEPSFNLLLIICALSFCCTNGRVLEPEKALTLHILRRQRVRRPPSSISNAAFNISLMFTILFPPLSSYCTWLPCRTVSSSPEIVPA